MAGQKGWLALLSVGAAIGMSACGDTKRSTKITLKNETESPVAAKKAAPVSTGDASQLLSNVAGMLRNADDSMVFSAAVLQLNRYLERDPGAIGPLEPQIAKQVEEFFGPQGATEAGRLLFIESDAEYLRNCFQLQKSARSLHKEDSPAQETAGRIFDWVIRQVQISDPGELPELLPFDVCLRGQGEARSRAWVFVEMLRQTGLLGCVALLPSENTYRLWACGLIDGERIVLFDPALGVMMVGSTGAPLTLGDVVKDPAQLSAMYPAKGAPSAADLKGLILALAIEPEMVSSRMTFLESRLAGESRANLKMDLPAALAKGKAAALKATGKPDVQVWLAPKQSRERLVAPAQRMRASGSMNLALSSKGPRALQLAGEFSQSLTAYMQMNEGDLRPTAVDVQMAINNVPFEMRVATVSRMPQDLVYFVGLLKAEQDSSTPTLAREWFTRYLDRFDSELVRADEVLLWDQLIFKLADEGPKTPAPPLGALWKAFPPATQTLASKLKQDAAGAIASRKELADAKQLIKSVSHRLQPNKDICKIFTDAINAGLKTPGLFKGVELPAGVGADLVKKLDANSPELAVVHANRMVLDSLLGEILAPANRLWIAGSLRQLALGLAQEKKYAEAIALLEKGDSRLSLAQQAELKHLAYTLKRQQAGK